MIWRGLSEGCSRAGVKRVECCWALPELLGLISVANVWFGMTWLVLIASPSKEGVQDGKEGLREGPTCAGRRRRALCSFGAFVVCTFTQSTPHE